jgi:hypothetical protein
MEVCPTDVVFAPAERIWRLLTDTRELAQWTGTTLVEGPAGPMSEGDHVVLGAGPLRMTFDVLENPRPADRHWTGPLAEAIETRRRTGSDSDLAD